MKTSITQLTPFRLATNEVPDSVVNAIDRLRSPTCKLVPRARLRGIIRPSAAVIEDCVSRRLAAIRRTFIRSDSGEFAWLLRGSPLPDPHAMRTYRLEPCAQHDVELRTQA